MKVPLLLLVTISLAAFVAECQKSPETLSCFGRCLATGRIFDTMCVPRCLAGESYNQFAAAQVQEQNNPFYFNDKRAYITKYSSENGRLRFLPRFQDWSPLLRGLKNWRFGVLRANPSTFVLPHHVDAEQVVVVTGGRGTLTYVHQGRRYSYNVETGYVLRIPAGAIVYLTSTHDQERLHVLKFLLPLNNPGIFEDFFGAGSQNYYGVLDSELLQTAFNTDREKLERLFGQQQQQQGQDVIISAPQEKLRALSQESISPIQRRERPRAPIDLLQQRPLFSNNYGQFRLAAAQDHEQLRDLDVSVSYVIIKQGALLAPYYNTKSIKVAYVTRGQGWYQMASPSISRQLQQQQPYQGQEQQQQQPYQGQEQQQQQPYQGQEQQQQGVEYQKVTAQLSPGDAFVIPAGDPITIGANPDSELHVVAFSINSLFNVKHFLAGKENIWNQVQPEAKELAFKVPAQEVEQVFSSQQESYFLPGNQQRGEQGRGQGGGKRPLVNSVMDFVF